jgi:hypothetical protein
VEIWFVEIDGRFFITGTPGRRDWFANLGADPRFVFHLKESAVADLAATARIIHDEATRRMVFEHPKASWYRDAAPLADLVRAAPMVEVTFDDS